jgi:hypothetical protein
MKCLENSAHVLCVLFTSPTLLLCLTKENVYQELFDNLDDQGLQNKNYVSFKINLQGAFKVYNKILKASHYRYLTIFDKLIKHN